MRAFLIPGDVSHLAKIEAYLNEKVCGILLHQRTDVDDLKWPSGSPPDVRAGIFTINSLLNASAETLDESDREIYCDLLERILRDTRVHFLAQRSGFGGAFNNVVTIEQVVYNSVLIIRQTDPSCMVSGSVPHSLEAWILAKCFENLGLPVYIIESTPIAFRTWICRGLESHTVVQLDGSGEAKSLTAATQLLLKQQRESRPGTRDEEGFHVSRIYLSSVVDSDSNKWWSLRRELGRLTAGRLRSLPFRLYVILLKRRLYKSYQQVASKELPRAPYVVFFMHYQPERSSLPLGLSYVQQWLAIRLLSLSLPEGWVCVVREHPTTWLKPLDVNVRTKNIYADIASLENVQVCSMGMDTFELIDKCKAVATLTGSSGFQALLRSKPVIALGLPPYKDHRACFHVSSIQDLLGAFSAIDGGDVDERLDDESLMDYLRWVERHSVCVDPEEKDWIRARRMNFAEIFRRVLSDEIQLR